MNGLLSISQLAKLRGVTTETLRHYDRIGLFKPTYVDPETNYRYYSILQYEKLGTIKELKQLGFSLEEIQHYFDNRNLKQSYDMLKVKHQELLQYIKDLKSQEKSLRKKLEFINSLPSKSENLKPSITNLDTRAYITTGNEVSSDEDMGYCYTSLENMLDEVSPILATDRIGLIVLTDPENKYLTNRWIPYIFVSSDEVRYRHSKTLPTGLYGTITSYEGFENQQHAYDILTSYLKEHNYAISGNPIMYFPIDLTITDSADELAFVMQIPIVPEE